MKYLVIHNTNSRVIKIYKCTSWWTDVLETGPTLKNETEWVCRSEGRSVRFNYWSSVVFARLHRDSGRDFWSSSYYLLMVVAKLISFNVYKSQFFLKVWHKFYYSRIIRERVTRVASILFFYQSFYFLTIFRSLPDFKYGRGMWYLFRVSFKVAGGHLKLLFISRTISNRLVAIWSGAHYICVLLQLSSVGHSIILHCDSILIFRSARHHHPCRCP